MVLTWGWALRINCCTLASSLEVGMELKEEEERVAYTPLYAACVLLLCHGHNGLAARATD